MSLKLVSRSLCSLPVCLLLVLTLQWWRSSPCLPSTGFCCMRSQRVCHVGKEYAPRRLKALRDLTNLPQSSIILTIVARWEEGNMESNSVFMAGICLVNVQSGSECVCIVKVGVMVWAGQQHSGFNADSWGWIIQTGKYFWIMRRGFGWVCCLPLSLHLYSLLVCSPVLSICIVYHECNISKRLDYPHNVRQGWFRCF